MKTNIIKKGITGVNIIRKKILCNPKAGRPHRYEIIKTIGNQYVILQCKKCGKIKWEKQPYYS